MSYELQYTSAERTLQPGLKGFGPVVVSQGIPATLQEKLVVLSGYRHLFPSYDAKAKYNPVNHSHLIVSAAGKRYHVLSRICDAGLDYSHRSNKLAHHVAIDPSECVHSGPAAVLAAPQFMVQSYGGQPQLLERGRALPRVDVKAAVCRAWQQVTSDAGWAGVLAQTACDATPQPTLIVYRLGVQPLALVLEALALVPPERRWNVTFSTFYSKLPPGVECLWRFVPSEDPELPALRKLMNQRVLDTTRTLDRPVTSPWVEAARLGHPPVLRSPREAATLKLVAEQATRPKSTQPATIDLSGVQLDPLLNPDLFNAELPSSGTTLLDTAAATEARAARRWWLLAASLFVLVAAGGIVAFAARSMQTPSSTPLASVSSNQPAQLKPVVKAAPRELAPAKVTAPQHTPAAKAVSTTAAQSQSSMGAPANATLASSSEHRESTPSPAASLPEIAPADEVLRELRRRRVEQRGLSLPAAPLDRPPSEPVPAWVELVPLPGVLPTSIQLSLHESADPAARFALEPQAATSDAAHWRVVRRTGSPAGDDELGEMRVTAGSLQFRWARVTSGMQPDRLGAARLLVRLHEQRESIRLQSPQILAEQWIAWSTSKKEFPAATPWNAQQRLEVVPVGRRIDPAEAPQTVLGPGEKRTLVVNVRTDVNIEVMLRTSSRAPCGLTLDYTLLTHIPNPAGGETVERMLLHDEALTAAEKLAHRKLEEHKSRAADDTAPKDLQAEESLWRQRVALYRKVRDWLASSDARELQLRARVYRRSDVE